MAALGSHPGKIGAKEVDANARTTTLI